MHELPDRIPPDRPSHKANGLARPRRQADLADPNRARGQVPVLVRAADLQPQPVAWLWPGRIALGKLTLLVGELGSGKSLLAIDVAARVTSGRPWPDNPQSAPPQGSVVLLNADDDPADTLRPRLDAAGADVARVNLLAAVGGQDKTRKYRRVIDLARDLGALHAAIRGTPDCRLVVIDALTACIGAGSRRKADVRPFLAPLAEIARRNRVAILAVVPFDKSDGKRVPRVLASLMAAAAARAVYLAADDRETPGRRFLIEARNSLAAASRGLAYRVADGPRIDWDAAPVEATLEEVLAPPDRTCTPSALAEAQAWLADVLALAPQPGSLVKEQARQDGIALRTLERARSRLGVIAGPSDFHGPWVWRLPDPPKDRQTAPHTATQL